MKILVVKYTPREERSNTKKLLDHFISKSKEKGNEVETINLSYDTPEFFDPITIDLYSKRNYGGVKLSVEETKQLEKFDLFTQKFVDADRIVFAYPIYNFGVPGAIKTFLDMIGQKGKTWDIIDGKYVGLCSDKKAILIMTAGGAKDYNMGAIDEPKKYLGFLGIKDVFDVGSFGINDSRPDREQLLDAAKKRIDELIEKEDF